MSCQTPQPAPRIGPFQPGTFIQHQDIPHPSMVVSYCDRRGKFVGYRVLTAAEIQQHRELEEDAIIDKHMADRGLRLSRRPMFAAMLARENGWS